MYCQISKYNENGHVTYQIEGNLDRKDEIIFDWSCIGQQGYSGGGSRTLGRVVVESNVKSHKCTTCSDSQTRLRWKLNTNFKLLDGYDYGQDTQFIKRLNCSLVGEPMDKLIWKGGQKFSKYVHASYHCKVT